MNTASPATLLFVDGHRKHGFFGPLIRRLEADTGAECRAISPPALLRNDLVGDLVVVNDESWPYCGAALPALHRRGIPSLHLADGILEWNNTWDNPARTPESVGMPLLQPVLASKIACLGRAQARILASWGNADRCEITGAPRFDSIPRRPAGSASRRAPFRVLIATARTPAFTQTQRERVLRSVLDLKQWFTHAGTGAIPVWRLAPDIEMAVNVPNTYGTIGLLEQLETVDAVITTPSSLQLEAMMAGLPVALLDYQNRPHYVPAAWSITAPEHIDTVVSQLHRPPPERLQYQEYLLHDNVECQSPATPRVIRLMQDLVAAGRDSRAKARPLRLAQRMVPESAEGHQRPSGPQRSQLHPGHPVFAQDDLSVLQAELAHLRRVVQMSPLQAGYRLLCELETRWWQRRNRRRL